MRADHAFAPPVRHADTAFSLSTSLQDGFLVVDPGAWGSDAPSTAFAISTCVPVNWRSDLTGLPCVIDLAQCEPAQREWLASKLEAEQDQRQRFPLGRMAICAHLVTSASLSEVAAHIARQILVLPVEKNGYRSGAPALWRIFDPRVFANLCWILDADALHAMLGPVSSWTFPWFKQWYTAGRAWPWVPKHAAVDISPATPRPVGMDVCERAQRISQINLVLGRLDLPDDSVWAQRVCAARRVELALDAARDRLHWHRADDQLSYAEHAVRYGDAFVNHPGLTAYWRSSEARDASGGWAEASRLLTDDDYLALERQKPSFEGSDLLPHPPTPIF